MKRRRSFRRRLRISLIVFSLVPIVLLVGVGAYLLPEAVALSDRSEAWERVGRSGGALIQQAERSADPALREAAAVHRRELEGSINNALRWEAILERLTRLLPFGVLLLGGALTWLAARAARSLSYGLSRPVAELAEWAGLVARRMPLPEASPTERTEARELMTLRRAFRRMAHELEHSRAQELEGERMRTWIGMARRVAHELKNPLTPMRLALSTLHRAAPPEGPSREAVEVIEAEASRLEEMARSFAQFGRLPEGPASEIDVREMMDYLVRTHLPPGVQSRLKSPVELPPVTGHHDALSRAFANLLLNAADAVEGAGAVTVVLRAVDGQVEVRVLDTGPGIPAENLASIWEPDFTTKARGTGLGLALVKQTVQAHGGSVAARNRPEGGAEVAVRLPATNGAAAHPAGNAAHGAG